MQGMTVLIYTFMVVIVHLLVIMKHNKSSMFCRISEIFAQIGTFKFLGFKDF